MSWTSAILIVAVVALFIWLRRTGLVPFKAAVGYVKHGAMLIDVRSAPEYIAGHLPNAINMPLNEIEALVPRKVKDKNSILLLHCQSGGRSGTARKKLLAMGYLKTYNVGSYGRAEQVIKSR